MACVIIFFSKLFFCTKISSTLNICLHFVSMPFSFHEFSTGISVFDVFNFEIWIFPPSDAFVYLHFETYEKIVKNRMATLFTRFINCRTANTASFLGKKPWLIINSTFIIVNLTVTANIGAYGLFTTRSLSAESAKALPKVCTFNSVSTWSISCEQCPLI